MSDLIKQIAADLQKQIDDFKPELGLQDVGAVLDAGDGIAADHADWADARWLR